MMAVPFQYLAWHYTRAIGGYAVCTKNILWYVGHLFSIGFLLRTLFLPWKRRDESYAGGGIEKYFEAVAVSMLARVVGFLIKVPVIIAGILVWCVVALCFAVGFLLWLLAPVLLAYGILFGSYMLYV